MGTAKESDYSAGSHRRGSERLDRHSSTGASVNLYGRLDTYPGKLEKTFGGGA